MAYVVYRRRHKTLQEAKVLTIVPRPGVFEIVGNCDSIMRTLRATSALDGSGFCDTSNHLTAIMTSKLMPGRTPALVCHYFWSVRRHAAFTLRVVVPSRPSCRLGETLAGFLRPPLSAWLRAAAQGVTAAICRCLCCRSL